MTSGGVCLAVVVFLVLQVCEATIYYSDGEYISSHDDYRAQGDYMSDWDNGQWELSGRLHQPKCVDIPTNMSLCKDIGYHQMRIPNLLDHDTVREVTSQAKSWVPLLGVHCHPDTKLFLCSLFSPVCLDRPIWPCRSLCQAIKGSCESYMMRYGFPWPEMLRCDKFPLDNDLCIGLQNDNKPDEQTCKPCNKPDTFESIVDNFCKADFALKFRIKENVISSGQWKLTAQKKKRIYKKGSLKKRDIRDMTLYMEGGATCECPPLDIDANPKTFYMAMGKKIGGKINIDFLQVYDKKSISMRRALRAIRKDNICSTGFTALTTDEEKDKGTKTDNKNRNKAGKSSGSKKGERRKKDRSKKGGRKRRRHEQGEDMFYF